MSKESKLGNSLVGDLISYVIGDTFIDFNVLPPSGQWTRIVDLLEEHGYRIVRKGSLEDAASRKVEWAKKTGTTEI